MGCGNRRSSSRGKNMAGAPTPSPPFAGPSPPPSHPSSGTWPRQLDSQQKKSIGTASARVVMPFKQTNRTQTNNQLDPSIHPSIHPRHPPPHAHSRTWMDVAGKDTGTHTQHTHIARGSKVGGPSAPHGDESRVAHLSPPRRLPPPHTHRLPMAPQETLTLFYCLEYLALQLLAG